MLKISILIAIALDIILFAGASILRNTALDQSPREFIPILSMK